MPMKVWKDEFLADGTELCIQDVKRLRDNVLMSKEGRRQDAARHAS
jgi:hypothetical protein